jgi:hypothetical protein
MSCDYNIIISFSIADEPRVNAITAYFESLADCQRAPVWIDDTERLPSKWYGGTRAFGKTLMLGAFHNLDLPKLIAFMESLEWYIPEDVQLLVVYENDDPNIFTDRLNHANLKKTDDLPLWDEDKNE